MNDVTSRNKLLRFFEDCTVAELRLALNEVKLWKEGVAMGLVKPEQASHFIESSKRLINSKLHVLGFPGFPS